MTKRPKCKTRGCSHRAAAKPSIKAYGYCGGCYEADTTRREWEVRAATSYADGRKAGLREAAEVCEAYWRGRSNSNANIVAREVAGMLCNSIIALAPPAAETVNHTITATSFDGRKASPYACDALPAAETVVPRG